MQNLTRKISLNCLGWLQVTDSCGVCKSNDEIGNCELLHEIKASLNAKAFADLQQQIETLKSTLKITETEIMSKSLENTELSTKLSLISDFKVTLESQYNKTLEAKTDDYNKTIALELKEIEDLKAEVQKQDQQIKILEEKIKPSATG